MAKAVMQEEREEGTNGAHCGFDADAEDIDISRESLNTET